MNGKTKKPKTDNGSTKVDAEAAYWMLWDGLQAANDALSALVDAFDEIDDGDIPRLIAIGGHAKSTVAVDMLGVIHKAIAAGEHPDFREDEMRALYDHMRKLYPGDGDAERFIARYHEEQDAERRAGGGS